MVTQDELSKNPEETEITDDGITYDAKGKVAGAKKQSVEVQNLEGDLASAQKALEEAQQKVNENWDLYVRSQAENENIRRRAQVDVENAHKYGADKFAKELLNVVDSLERGLEAANIDEPTVKPIYEGIELTYKLLIDTLAKFGIVPLNPMGEKFNPKEHEALSAQPSADCEPNTILTVVQQGFMQHERILRPARVIVSKAMAENLDSDK